MRVAVHHARTRLGAVLVAVLASLLATLATAAPSAAERAEPGGLSGYAFDARCAPTQEQMDAWLTSSPFWGVGVYIGGSTMSCRPVGTDPGQPHLDATWVQRQAANGWHLLPIWVGPQASCHPGYTDRIDPAPASSYAAADARGRSEAAAAVTRARELGLGPGSTLWYDIEGGFDVTDTDCRRSALRFLSGWTTALHEHGYDSGVYSSVSAAIHALDNAAGLSPGSYAMPDRVWYAWYNNRADTYIDPMWVRGSTWEHERVHQYAAQQVATYGGVTLTIDRNYLELHGGSQTPRVKRHCRDVELGFRAYPTLRTGSQGDRVRALQCLLKKHGRYRGRLDGELDREVVAALRSYQRHHDLATSRKATARVWVSLLSQGSTPLLKVGSADDAVRRVQRALAAATGRRVRDSGIFTRATEAAVLDYQAGEGIAPTGVVADDTWQALLAGNR